MEVCYWALLFMPLVILLYLYSLQLKGDSNKKQNKKISRSAENITEITVMQTSEFVPAAVATGYEDYDVLKSSVHSPL
jgi:hypothetical protein